MDGEGCPQERDRCPNEGHQRMRFWLLNRDNGQVVRVITTNRWCAMALAELAKDRAVLTRVDRLPEWEGGNVE